MEMGLRNRGDRSNKPNKKPNKKKTKEHEKVSWPSSSCLLEFFGPSHRLKNQPAIGALRTSDQLKHMGMGHPPFLYSM